MKLSTRQRAIHWMCENMKVVEMFEKFGQQLVDRARCFGVNLLRERVRWECVYEFDGDDYKFRNDFSPYVARYLLWKHPDWAPYMTCKRTDDETDEIALISDTHLVIAVPLLPPPRVPA